MGLRPGEVRALEIADFSDGWLRINKAVKGPSVTSPVRGTKTGKPKQLPVPEILQEWIARYVDPRDRLKGAPLFPNPNTGRIWNYWTMRDLWKRACKQVGIDVGLYEGTKHTFATDAIARGVPERSLQTFLGHADVRRTRRYAQLQDNAVVDVLPKRFVAHLSPAENRVEKAQQNKGLMVTPAGFEPALPA